MEELRLHIAQLEREIQWWLRIVLIIFGMLTIPLIAQAQPNVYVEPSVPVVNETITVAPGRFAAYRVSLTQGSALVAAFTVEGGLAGC